MKQLAIDFYPTTPGYKRRETSRNAAKAIANRAPKLRDRAFEVLKTWEMTADEIAHALQVSILSIRPRISELVELGMVEESGNYRENDSGKAAIVWKVTKRK